MRHWLLIARHNAGKSVFASQMSPRNLVLDLDGRWSEQEHERGVPYVIPNGDVLDVIAQMERVRTSASDVGTIVVDSGTAMLDGIQAIGRLEEVKAKANNKAFNINHIHKVKADTMRALSYAALKWHCDVLWIFHHEDRAYGGKATVRTTLPKTEMEALKKVLNAVLTIVTDQHGRRGIRVEWSRFHDGAANGAIVWDTAGFWKGVPDKLDALLANYLGTEGYNGNEYSYDWLVSFLETKGVKTSVEAITKKFGAEPPWFDRNAYTQIIEANLEKVAA